MANVEPDDAEVTDVDLPEAEPEAPEPEPVDETLDVESSE